MGTCPLLGKEKQSLDRGRNKWQHPKRMNLLSICHMTMHVTGNAVSLDQLEPKKAHEELLKDWQLFLFQYKNSLQPQANNSLSCSWNNSYCALGPTLAASTKLMCIFQLDNKSTQSAALFLKIGKWLWHFPQPRFLPRLGLWECPCCAGLLSLQTPHFPRVHFCFRTTKHPKLWTQKE